MGRNRIQTAFIAIASGLSTVAAFADSPAVPPLPVSITCGQSLSMVNQVSQAHVTFTDPFDLTSIAKELQIIPIDASDLRVTTLEFDVKPEDFFGGPALDPGLVDAYPSDSNFTFTTNEVPARRIIYPIPQATFMLNKVATTTMYGTFLTQQIKLKIFNPKGGLQRLINLPPGAMCLPTP